MRFGTLASAGNAFAFSGGFARSSGRTGLAFRTSGSPGTGRAAETAAPTAFGIVGTGEAAAAVAGGEAVVGADATLLAGVSATAGGAVVKLGVDAAAGETWAAGSPRPGAIRCKVRINFITEKPITNTRMPKMSGIGEMRSRLRAARRLTTGALTGLAAGLS